MGKITKKEFIEMFGEDPEDVLGADWENEVDEYVEDQEFAGQCEKEKAQSLEEAEKF